MAALLYFSGRSDALAEDLPSLAGDSILVRHEPPSPVVSFCNHFFGLHCFLLASCAIKRSTTSRAATPTQYESPFGPGPCLGLERKRDVTLCVELHAGVTPAIPELITENSGPVKSRFRFE